jgi:chemotaxis signal transduction protein
MCVLTLGGELFAIDLRHVSEVFEVEAVTVVPSMPSLLTGVTNLRGTVITLVDLRGSLGPVRDRDRAAVRGRDSPWQPTGGSARRSRS